MTDEEKKKKIHKILELVFEVNEIKQKTRDLTGDKPTLFFEYAGHINSITVSANEHGWVPGEEKEYYESICFDFADSEDRIKAVIDYLQGLKSRVEVDKNGTDGLSDH